MDFSKYGLTDEQVSSLTTDYELDIKGLKAKNSDLIEREKAQKEANEALAIEMATKEEDAKVALAEKDGTVEQYKNAVAERDAKLETVQREFKETESKRVLESAVNDFSSVLADDPAGRMFMQKQFQDAVSVVDGVIKPIDPTKSIEDLKQSLVTDKSFAKYIKTDVGSGAGSVGSNSSNPVTAQKLTPEQQRVNDINARFSA